MLALLKTTDANSDRVFAVNLERAFFPAHAAARQSVAWGAAARFMNISSIQ